MRRRVVKAEVDTKNPEVTAKGGLVLAQKTALTLGLWSDVKRLLPARKDPTQGFPTEMAVCAIVHGLLSGGRGFQATEALREDRPLLRMLGMSAAPSAETCEKVIKSAALRQNDAVNINQLLRTQTKKILKELPRKELLSCHGFFPLWGDGTLLEVTGKSFDSIKTIKGKAGQLCGGVFAGPVAAGIRFALGGEGEKTVVVEETEKVFREVLRPLKLAKETLMLYDGLYGNEPTLARFEALGGAHYIAGLGGLKAAHAAMAQLPEACWTDTGEVASLRWEASGVATAWVQGEAWKRKRTMVCRRYRRAGEMFWEYRAVATNLEADDPRVMKLMTTKGLSYSEAIWKLYSYKQGMENYWKELLIDMGLHHPPCARAEVNAVFHGLGAVAWNLSVATRRLSLAGGDRTMRLWRLRRDFFDLAATAAHHARTLIMRFVDSRRSQVDRLLSAMGRL